MVSTLIVINSQNPQSFSDVLHYGHAAAPNDKILEDEDLALLDMGAEYNFYGSDISCSYPVNGKFTPDQALIYNAVLDAKNAVISTMKSGTSRKGYS
ncbi:xaa-Pro dipeptidase-like [Pyrus x bretschneideri]|uniref:xaa-Pro dipeptidase-like n=1 Tax=Pyrus x bretschneideri TaxID=225117 RepID=UPI00202FE60A|nr:xaa-Pro dipeptidase-like [Pyrus x bretschneideri]